MAVGKREKKAKSNSKRTAHTWDRAGRTQALLAAAMAEFSKVGFENATTKAIAASANCSEGLIGHYFGGKEGLLFAVIEANMQRRRPEEAKISEGEVPGEPLDAILCRLMRSMAVDMWERRDFIRLCHGRSMTDVAFNQFIARSMQQRHTRLAEKLALLATRGLISPEEDASVLATSVMGLVFQVGFLGPHEFGLNIDQILSTVTICAEVLAAGLTARMDRMHSADRPTG